MLYDASTYHLSIRAHPTLHDKRWLDAKVCRGPQHQVSQLPNLYAADKMTHALGDSRIDGVLADVSLHSEVIRTCAFILFEVAALHLVLVRRVPCSQNDLTAATHGLRIRRHHRDGAKIVKHVFCSNRLGTNTRLGKCYIFWDILRQVMTYHQHVQMLVQGVAGVRSRRICR